MFSFETAFRPRYQSDSKMAATEWKRAFLEADVEELQKHKQHHVHLPAEHPGGPRMPLAHCRDPKDPELCKAGFPRTAHQIEETVLVCAGLAQKMGMPSKGRRNCIGSLHGPMNDPNINGTHPALLAGLRCNSDVQVPYRFPIASSLHSKLCSEDCVEHHDEEELIWSAQVRQNAQAGYACDYQNKRLPIAVHEITEWQKGQRQLANEMANQSTGYVGARITKRFMSDAYARGVVRGAVETANLLAYARPQDPLRAESIKTSPVTD